MDSQFALDSAALRRQRRVLLLALAAYLPGALVLIVLTVWAASRADDEWLAVLIGLSALQVSYLAFACGYQVLTTRRLLARAGTRAGHLTVGAAGVSDGERSWAWPDVTHVRAYRTSIPHLRVRLRGASLRGRRLLAARPPGQGSCRTITFRSGSYGVGIDDLIAAFAPFAQVSDPDMPLAPSRDARAGTTTFFFNGWQLSARRRRNLRSCWQVPLMLIPAAVGLALAGAWPAGVLVLAPGVVLVIVTTRRVRATDRLLRIGRDGKGRLLLTADNLTLAGTDVAIPWSHVTDTTLVHGEEPRVTGVIACPDRTHQNGQDGGRCAFAGRRIAFSIGARMYATTIEEVADAFGEHVQVAASGAD